MKLQRKTENASKHWKGERFCLGFVLPKTLKNRKHKQKIHYMKLHQPQKLLHRKENNYLRIRNNRQSKQPEEQQKTAAHSRLYWWLEGNSQNTQENHKFKDKPDHSIKVGGKYSWIDTSLNTCRYPIVIKNNVLVLLVEKDKPNLCQ